jgi:hypothetical protein
MFFNPVILVLRVRLYKKVHVGKNMSSVECMLIRLEAMGSVPSTKKEKENKEENMFRRPYDINGYIGRTGKIRNASWSRLTE